MSILTLSRLQAVVSAWSRTNFGDQPAHRPLLGVVEEVGELSHAYLKSEQGIRGTAAEHEAAGKDAVGDILVYLADFCDRQGWDMQAIVEETWSQVSRRDWKANPITGDP